MPSRLTCVVGYQLEIGKVCQCLVLFNSDVPNYQSTNQIMSQHWLVPGKIAWKGACRRKILLLHVTLRLLWVLNLANLR